MELRDESVCKEIKRKIERSGDNIKIVKLTQAIIKLQRELDRSYNKKRDSNGHQNYNRRSDRKSTRLNSSH